MLQAIVGSLILCLIFLAIVDVILYIVFKIKRNHIKHGEDKFNECLKDAKKLHDEASLNYEQKKGET